MSDDEAELKQLVDTLAQVEQQVRAWEAQLETLAAVRTEIWQARTTLDGLQEEPEGREMLVPVGYNTSLFASLGSKEITTTSPRSRECLGTRSTRMPRRSRRCRTMLTKNLPEGLTLHLSESYMQLEPFETREVRLSGIAGAKGSYSVSFSASSELQPEVQVNLTFALRVGDEPGWGLPLLLGLAGGGVVAWAVARRQLL